MSTCGHKTETSQLLPTIGVITDTSQLHLPGPMTFNLDLSADDAKLLIMGLVSSATIDNELTPERKKNTCK